MASEIVTGGNVIAFPRPLTDKEKMAIGIAVDQTWHLPFDAAQSVLEAFVDTLTGDPFVSDQVFNEFAKQYDVRRRLFAAEVERENAR